VCVLLSDSNDAIVRVRTIRIKKLNRKAAKGMEGIQMGTKELQGCEGTVLNIWYRFYAVSMLVVFTQWYLCLTQM
jgi:hypothetical protein